MSCLYLLLSLDPASLQSAGLCVLHCLTMSLCEIGTSACFGLYTTSDEHTGSSPLLFYTVLNQCNRCFAMQKAG